MIVLYPGLVRQGTNLSITARRFLTWLITDHCKYHILFPVSSVHYTVVTVHVHCTVMEATAETHRIHTVIFHASAVCSKPQPVIWFTSFSHLNTWRLEFPTSTIGTWPSRPRTQGQGWPQSSRPRTQNLSSRTAQGQGPRPRTTTLSVTFHIQTPSKGTFLSVNLCTSAFWTACTALILRMQTADFGAI